jgi:hypothetical protein
VYRIADHLLQSGQDYAEPVNIASPFNYPVKEIVAAIESFLKIRSNYIEVNKGSCFPIDLSEINSLVPSLFPEKKEGLQKILQKYF